MLRPCHDVFHEDCLIQRLETERSCPICNVDLNWEHLDMNKSYFSNEDHSSKADDSYRLSGRLDITGNLQTTPRNLHNISLETIKDIVKEKKIEMRKKNRILNESQRKESDELSFNESGIQNFDPPDKLNTSRNNYQTADDNPNNNFKGSQAVGPEKKNIGPWMKVLQVFRLGK